MLFIFALSFPSYSENALGFDVAQREDSRSADKPLRLSGHLSQALWLPVRYANCFGLRLAWDATVSPSAGAESCLASLATVRKTRNRFVFVFCQCFDCSG